MDVAELQRQVEYKPAPSPLLVVQALADTYSLEEDEERLSDPEAARRWLVGSDLARGDVTVSPAEFDRLRELRAAVRELIEANRGGERASGGADAGARLLAGNPVPLSAAADGSLDLDLEPVASVDHLIAQVAGIIFRSQLLDEWPRLKICASDECRWAFYDSSRNRGGTWCQMEVCGNRSKNRRYRERSHAAGEPATHADEDQAEG